MSNGVTSTERQLKQRTTIMFVYFFFFGFGGGSWLVRIPELREQIGVTTSVLGWVLFAGSVGAMSALLISGRFVSRFGARAAIVVGFVTLAIGQLVQALALPLHSAVIVAIGGLITGVGFGIGDVGINVQGANLEKLHAKSLLPQLHGSFSLGSLIGTGIGISLIGLNIALATQLVVIAILTTTIVVFSYRALSTTVGKETTTHKTAAQPSTWTKRIIFLGLGIMGLSLAEGGANDWLSLSIVDDYHLDTITAGVTFSILTAAMVITRFTGGALVDKYGRVFALKWLGIAGVIGILLVILSPTIVLTWVGAALWGAGVALGFPLFISAAADGENSSPTVAKVTAFGYAAFLVGPPLLGFIGQEWGLLNMFYILAGCVAIAVIFSSAAAPLSSQKS